MLISVVCFVIALLGAITVLHGVNITAWTVAGLLAWAADVALAGYPLGIPYGRREPPA